MCKKECLAKKLTNSLNSQNRTVIYIYFLKLEHRLSCNRLRFFACSVIIAPLPTHVTNSHFFRFPGQLGVKVITIRKERTEWVGFGRAAISSKPFCSASVQFSSGFYFLNPNRELSFTHSLTSLLFSSFIFHFIRVFFLQIGKNLFWFGLS